MTMTYFERTFDALVERGSTMTTLCLEHGKRFEYQQPVYSAARDIARCSSLPWRWDSAHQVMREIGAYLAKHNEVHDVPVAKRDPARMYELVEEAVHQSSGVMYNIAMVEIAIALCGVRNAGKRWEEMMKRFELPDDDENAWRSLPWRGEPWFTPAHSAMHMPHMSKSRKGMVAFAESPAKLVADRFTITRPGRYLHRFFSHVLSASDIKMWAERFEAMEGGHDLTLRFVEGHDRDEWLRVYRDGPESCMSGKESSEYVAPYAHKHSVLRLAVAEQFGHIVGRAIVREDEKEYVRVYPNPHSDELRMIQRRFTDMLQGAGYKHGNLLSVLLDAIPIKGRRSRYVCPYVDCGTGPYPYGKLVTTEHGTFIEVGERGSALTNTSGEARIDERDDNEGQTQCDDCNEWFDEDDDDIGYHDRMGRYVCTHCLRYGDYVLAFVNRYDQEWINVDRAKYCDDTEEYYDDDETAARHGVYRCEESGDLHCEENLCMTSRGYLHNELCVSLDYDDAEGNGFAHRDDVRKTHNGLTLHADDAVELYDGRITHENDVFHMPGGRAVLLDDVVVVGTDNYGVAILALKGDPVTQQVCLLRAA
jgi:hypothetical protein